MLSFLYPSRPLPRPTPAPSRPSISPYSFPSGEFSPVVLRSIFEGTLPGQPFKPHDVYSDVWKVGYYGMILSFGFVVLVNSADRPKDGWVSILRRQSKIVSVLLLAGPAVAIGEGVSANLRGRESAWNAATGGLLGGAIIGQLGRTSQQNLGIAVLFSLMATANEFFPWTGQHGRLPYDPDLIVERDNERLMQGLVLRKWEDIKPPPGQGYGIYPGADRSYTLDAKLSGKPITPEEWAQPQRRDEIWPKGGNRVLRPVAPKLPPLEPQH
ncbi:hypothetical protein BDY24DRAFT_129654 [Mrakia frigida]|uniref:uncharacterized protein n=1 Tax=Mrakia frigida TaxID=29902 RepID=UPI003FCC0AD4